MNDKQHVRTRINLVTLFVSILAIVLIRPNTQLLLIQIMCAANIFNTLMQYAIWIIISKQPKLSS